MEARYMSLLCVAESANGSPTSWQRARPRSVPACSSRTSWKWYVVDFPHCTSLPAVHFVAQKVLLFAINKLPACLEIAVITVKYQYFYP